MKNFNQIKKEIKEILQNAEDCPEEVLIEKLGKEANKVLVTVALFELCHIDWKITPTIINKKVCWNETW